MSGPREGFGESVREVIFGFYAWELDISLFLFIVCVEMFYVDVLRLGFGYPGLDQFESVGSAAHHFPLFTDSIEIL